MRRRRSATLGLVALTVVAGVLAAQDGTPDGLPDVNGSWTGKMKLKTAAMTTGGARSADSLAVTLSLNHGGPDLLGSLDFVDSEGPRTFALNGKVGNGSFWLSGETEPGYPVVVSGRVVAKGKVLKATGIAAHADRTSELKLSVKR